MRTLIVYASLTGTSKAIAQHLQSQFENATVVNLSQNKHPNLSQYDTILIGSGIYFQKIHKQVKAFLRRNQKILFQKSFGIFYCCGSTGTKNQAKYLKKNFSKQLQQHAKTISYVGGRFNYNQARFPQNIVVYVGIKLFRLQNKLPRQIQYDLINKFVKKMKSE